ncbi:MAG TPA: hypothetical protein VFH50_01305 [Acidimicrobiales bacterium]|nr:hypothetical protein [Acidimicrobiales bacterium]
MSSLWTPGGEHRVPPGSSSRPPPAGAPPSPPPPPPPPPPRRPEAAEDADDAGLDPQAAAQLAELQRQLAQTPAEIVVANHAFGLFELAALHLSREQPDFAAARLAIDAMAAVVEGLAGRLGEAEPDLVTGLAQIRLAFVQVQAAKGGSAN